MANRKEKFVEGEYYHAYNRGTDKRSIFMDSEDLTRFIKSIEEFNVVQPIGSIYENSFIKDKEKNKLVNIICYALNPNHFHFLLTPLVENGVEKFMQKLGTGYTMYFNNKLKRKGSLFQGTFKSVYVDSNEYLLHLSAYINLNDKVHQLGGLTSKLSKTSFGVYEGELNPKFDKILGDISIITEQFKNPQEYKEFAEEILPDIVERKKLLKELETLTLEEED
ncbi:MAG TPA: transposase [Candidatus Paceibacterota bacterium]|nr:transposase [Candidatus Paceibacterota bacterium]